VFIPRNLIIRFLNLLTDEDGQALAEYALILGFIAVVCVVALTGIGLAVTGSLDNFASAFGGGGS